MSDVQRWSETAADNNQVSPDGWQEGMKRSEVNDSAREDKRALRKFYAAAEFTNVYDTDGDAWVAAFFDATTVELIPQDAQVTDISSRFKAGTRIRLTGGASPQLGFIVSASFSTPRTRVIIVIDDASALDGLTDLMETGVVRGLLEKTAYYPTGTTTGQFPPEVPTIDDLGDQATLDGGHDPEGDGSPGIDADTVDGMHASDLITAPANAIYNGEFLVWQRGLTIDTDVTEGRIYTNDHANYTADRWKLLSGETTNDKNDLIVVSQDIVSVQTGFYSALKMTGTTNVLASDFAGVFQILEARDSFALINQPSVSMGVEMKQSGAGGIVNARFMVIGWNGAIDSPVADPILNWNSPGDPGGPSFVAGTWVKMLDSGQLTIGTSWARFTEENVDFSAFADIKNIGILIYIDDTVWGNTDALHITGVRLEATSSASEYQHLDYSTELTRCQRFFTSTFEQGEDPRQNTGIPGAANGFSSSSFATHNFIQWRFSVSMFQTPNVSGFNPSAAVSDEVRKIAGATNQALGDFTSHAGRSGLLFVQGSGSTNDMLAVHMTADAEF